MIVRNQYISMQDHEASAVGLRYIFVGGPTASGKSKLAAGLADRLNGELVNCDSIQLYRGFDIGSAKVGDPSADEPYVHLCNLLEWNQSCDAAQYATLARNVIREVNSRGKLGIVVGGSGLYFRSLRGERFHDLPADLTLRHSFLERPSQSLWDELMKKDPERANQLHPRDKLRCARALELYTLTRQSFAELTNCEQVGEGDLHSPLYTLLMSPERSQLHQQITKRVDRMLRRGLVEEVRSLLQAGCLKDAKPMLSIGYKQVVEFLDGVHLQKDLPEKITIATRQYAKRQSTWFRKVFADVCLRDLYEIDSLAAGIVDQIKGK